MNADGTQQERLTNSPAVDTAPAWSPDGQQIAFASNRDGNFEIYVMDAEGTGVPVNLTNNAAVDRDPAWSPDGQRIAFVSLRDGNATGTSSPNPEIYVMNANGSDQTRLTTNAGHGSGTNTHGDHDPDWSPDGQQIAFISGRRAFPEEDAYERIWVMNAGGSGQVPGSDQAPLGHTANDHRNPAWSPDGRRIAVARNNLTPEAGDTRDFESEVFAMNANGSGRTNLTRDAAFDGEPAWQPVPDADGDALLDRWEENGIDRTATGRSTSTCRRWAPTPTTRTSSSRSTAWPATCSSQAAIDADGDGLRRGAGRQPRRPARHHPARRQRRHVDHGPAHRR